jgi:hypothetical protein
MDGRIQFPVIDYIKRKFCLDFVDVITEPSPNKILSQGNDTLAIERIKKCVEISVIKHGSGVIAISAHHDCAGNPQEKEYQIRQLIASIEVVKSWTFGVNIIGLWIDEQWTVDEIE